MTSDEMTPDDGEPFQPLCKHRNMGLDRKRRDMCLDCGCRIVRSLVDQEGKRFGAEGGTLQRTNHPKKAGGLRLDRKAKKARKRAQLQQRLAARAAELAQAAGTASPSAPETTPPQPE